MSIEGYSIGQIPPGLQPDGSFDAPNESPEALIGVLRVRAIVDDEGRILIVDPMTRRLKEDEAVEELDPV